MPPPLNRILETVIYCNDLDAAEKFYGGILGLHLGSRAGNRGLHYVVNDQVLLIFNPDETVKGVVVPPHGGMAPGTSLSRSSRISTTPGLNTCACRVWSLSRNMSGRTGMRGQSTFATPAEMSQS